MRLACYGWVEREAGSVASAGHTVVAELLRRGHRVDLFADRDHVPRPAGIDGRDGFTYVGLTRPRTARLPAPLYQPAELVLGAAWRARWRRRCTAAAATRHATEPYDAVLTLGVAPAFVLPGVPTVAWLQSPPHTELEAIRRLRAQIERVSGRRYYAAVTTYYLLRSRRDRRVLDACDEVICGSSWSVEALVAQGLAAERVHALPYPIDLDRFRPGEVAAAGDGPLVLSVGRLDPRKRLDLLVAAFDIVAASEAGARLLVVGKPGRAPNQLSLLDASPNRRRIEYRPAVAQAAVADLLRGADVLVQPSENENFGSAVAEALACGVPAVVGPTNGTADYLDAASMVFDAYTPEAVAGAVAAVLDRRRRDPARVTRSARASAERWFPVAAVVDRLEAVLRGAMARHGAPRRPA